MTDAAETELILDPPDPALPDVQQRDIPLIPAVPVDVQGIVNVRIVPNRAGPAGTHDMTTVAQTVLGADLRRARATLWSTVAWQYMNKTSGSRVPVAANMVISVTHGDEIAARVTTSTGVLSFITEYYGE